MQQFCCPCYPWRLPESLLPLAHQGASEWLGAVGRERLSAALRLLRRWRSGVPGVLRARYVQCVVPGAVSRAAGVVDGRLGLAVILFIGQIWPRLRAGTTVFEQRF